MDSPILPQLIGLLRRLYADTQGFLDHPDDSQGWYDRGYANGMVLALRELGQGESLPTELELELDPDGEAWGRIAAQALTPWGRAHAHGLEMGRTETFEILEGS